MHQNYSQFDYLSTQSNFLIIYELLSVKWPDCIPGKDVKALYNNTENLNDHLTATLSIVPHLMMQGRFFFSLTSLMKETMTETSLYEDTTNTAQYLQVN